MLSRTAFIYFFLFFCSITSIFAQMQKGNDLYYGNEWINDQQFYFKIKIGEDGIYRLDAQQLQAAGIDLEKVKGEQFRLFSLGKEVALHPSTKDFFKQHDQIIFYAQKNKANIDTFLYAQTEDLLNPQYSLVNDTLAYFLTWNEEKNPNQTQFIENIAASSSKKYNFCWKQQQQVFATTFLKNPLFGQIYASSFMPSEGFADALTTQKSVNFQLNHIAAVADSATLSFRLGSNVNEHHLSFRWNGRLLGADFIEGGLAKSYVFKLHPSELKNNATLIIESQGGNDKFALAYVELTYPSALNFENKNEFTFQLNPSNNAQVIEFEQFNATADNIRLLDISNNLLLKPIWNAQTQKFSATLPPSQSPRNILIFDIKNAKNLRSPEKMNWQNLKKQSKDFVFVTHSSLLKDDILQQYADFRGSSAGGNYKTLIVNIEQLYDQFSYGIDRHPLAIRNFIHFIEKDWAKPQYIFLIGKGREYHSVRTKSQLENPNNQSFLIPTFGYPASDNLLASSNLDAIPNIVISRLSVSNTAEIKAYFDKIKEQESLKNLPQDIAAKAWMKNILHLSGGNTTVEQNTMRITLENLANQAKNSKFGANTLRFYKTSIDAIQNSQSQNLFDFFNNGTTLVSFLGHSGPNNFDFSIDDPSNFKNKGKYPLLLAMGCYVGNTNTQVRGLSERFCLMPNAGTIAFIASSNLVYLSDLQRFGGYFYQNAFDKMYGETIGNIFQQSLKALAQKDLNVLAVLCQTLTIHGDPAVRLNAQNGFDYAINSSSAQFLPQNPTLQDEYLTLNVAIHNLGMYQKDSLDIAIKQQLPNGQLIQLPIFKTLTPENNKVISIKIPHQGIHSIGKNTFFVQLDPYNKIKELSEQNNELILNNGQKGIEIVIGDNKVTAAYPTPYAIVNTQNVTLKATIANPFVKESIDYVFEIDTINTFSSPFKQQIITAQKGNPIEYSLQNLRDKQVYYWRVAKKEAVLNWDNSSFWVSKTDSLGWTQQHFHQLAENELSQLNFEAKRLVFEKTTTDFRATNYWIGRFLYQPQIFLNNIRRQNLHWIAPYGNVGVAILDSVTHQLLPNPTNGAAGSYGIPHTVSGAAVFIFKTDSPPERKKLINFIENDISPNNWVLFYTAVTPNSSYYPEQWAADSLIYGQNLFSILEKYGATQIRKAKGNLPYAILFKKQSGTIDEKLAQTFEDEIEIKATLAGRYNQGTLKSKVIGAAKRWKSLSFSYKNVEKTPNDGVHLRIWALDKDKKNPTLWKETNDLSVNLDNLVAKDFPFIQLEFELMDSVANTAPSIDFIKVHYDKATDYIFDTKKQFNCPKDTLLQGETFHIDFTISNLHEQVTNDSLSLKYTLKSPENEQNFYKTFRPLRSNNDTIWAKIDLPTNNVAENANLVFEINPDKKIIAENHSNNIVSKIFFINKDISNPLLFVTFDGKDILNGEIVSSLPKIDINLIDQNPYLWLNDTALFNIQLKLPNGQTQAIYFSNEAITFFPANNANNKTLVVYQPILQPGIYTLIVQAKDKSGNKAGNLTYQKTFKVIDDSNNSISCYPNPFQQQTKFIYNLKENELLSPYFIEIFNTAGQLMRTLKVENPKLGTNFAYWDATNEKGENIANGIYFYQLITQKRAVLGSGKVVLIR